MSACEAEGDGSIPFEHPFHKKEKIVVAMLSRQTLVLNRNWQPVGVASVARSLTLVAAERARIVDPIDFQLYNWGDWAKLIPQEDELFVQSVTFRIRVPEVITLTEYDRVPTNAVTFSRRNIYKRDRFTCQYCGANPTSPVVDISPYGATTGRSNFPLHLRSDYFFGEFHSEIIEQNLLMV